MKRVFIAPPWFLYKVLLDRYFIESRTQNWQVLFDFCRTVIKRREKGCFYDVSQKKRQFGFNILNMCFVPLTQRNARKSESHTEKKIGLLLNFMPHVKKVRNRSPLLSNMCSVEIHIKFSLLTFNLDPNIRPP